MNLPQRMQEAAKTLEEISVLYGYRHPDEAGWSAHELRYEAGKLGESAPSLVWDNCAGHVYTGED